MLEKKLITVGGAVGILALGACFLPPPQRKPPVPNLPPYLSGIRTIAIRVDDASSGDHIGTAQISSTTAGKMNSLWRQNAVHSEPWQAGKTCDATLKIVILQKTSSRGKRAPSSTPWTFALCTSSTLTARDGTLLWKEPAGRSQFTHWFAQDPPPNFWNSRALVNEAAYSLAITVGARLRFSQIKNDNQQPTTESNQ